MHSFRTVYSNRPSADEIDYSSNLFFIGSCFASNVSGILNSLKFKVTSNPFGIVYNPISIAKQLNEIVDLRTYTSKDLTLVNAQWASMNHHGSFSGEHPPKVLENINTTIKNAHDNLKQANYLFITLGTAWYYQLKSTQELVSNCHKLPSREFDHLLAAPEEITHVLTQALEKVKSFNPEIKVVFSISPVRHLKTGFFENNVSKGHLFTAIYPFIQSERANYFGAYEMVMDDLRDYRFFNEDMTHPSREAINYVMHHFENTFFGEATKTHVQQVKKLMQACGHKPFNWQSDAHQKFIATTQKKISQLEKQLKVDFSNELQQLNTAPK